MRVTTKSALAAVLPVTPVIRTESLLFSPWLFEVMTIGEALLALAIGVLPSSVRGRSIAVQFAPWSGERKKPASRPLLMMPTYTAFVPAPALLWTANSMLLVAAVVAVLMAASETLIQLAPPSSLRNTPPPAPLTPA